MSAVATLSLPTGLIPRFALFIEAVKRAMGEGMVRRPDTLGPLAILLGNYFSATLRRLTALHARFAAGKLPVLPRARRPAARRETADRPRPEPRPPAIPRGPVLPTVFGAAFDEHLQTLIDDPEMRALLAASPQAGRILRPLWRKLSVGPLPEALRLPPRPRRPSVKPAAGPPGLRPVVSPNGFVQWEPTPCFPPFGAPPRPNPAPTARPAAPIAAPPPAARPPDRGRPTPPAAKPRPFPPPFVMGLFQR